MDAYSFFFEPEQTNDYTTLATFKSERFDPEYVRIPESLEVFFGQPNMHAYLGYTRPTIFNNILSGRIVWQKKSNFYDLVHLMWDILEFNTSYVQINTGSKEIYILRHVSITQSQNQS